MRWEAAYKKEWTESIPSPLDLTDTEILDWMADTGAWAIWSHGKWHVTVEGCKDVTMEKLRDAVCLAAAYEREL